MITCPNCDSDRVTVTEEQKFFVNTLEHWCHSVKAHDPNAKANCLDCGWEGERRELKDLQK